MQKENKYLYLYLSFAFPLAWTIIISCGVFAKRLEPVIGKLTLTHPIIIFVLYLPSIAGLLTYYAEGGFAAVRGITAKLLPRSKDLIWLPIVIAIFFIFALVVRYGSICLGVPVPEINLTFSQMLGKILWNFIEEAGLFGGVFGWIGFLLPFFQKKFRNNILSALLTGFIFGLWVLPGYDISSVAATSSYLLYVLQLMSFMVFASYIFNVTEGNLAIYILTFGLMAAGSHIQLYYFVLPVQMIQIVFFALAAISIKWILKYTRLDYSLQTFPDFILNKSHRTMAIHKPLLRGLNQPQMRK